MQYGSRHAEGIRATVAYLRTEFPDQVVGHHDHPGNEHLFYVSRQRYTHRLILGTELLDNSLPLNLIVKLQGADVAGLLRKAGSTPLRLAP